MLSFFVAKEGENMPEIDSLQIQIKADSNNASKNIDKLADSMRNLANSLTGGSNRLFSVATGIRSISDAATGFKGGKSSELASLANALSKFSGIDTNSIHGISSAMRDLSSGMAGTQAIDVSGIVNLAAALSRLGGKLAGYGTENLIKLKDDLAYFVNGMNSIGGLYFDVNGLASLIASISRLGWTSATNAAANLPRISSSLQEFVTKMNGIGSLSFNASSLGELISGISKLGSVASGRAVTNLPLLAKELKAFMQTLSTAPMVSRNLIDMTNALARLAKTGSSAGKSASSLTSKLNSFSSSAGRAKSSSKGLASALGKMYASYWLVFRSFGKIGKAIDIASSLTEVENVVRQTFGQYEGMVDKLAETSIKDFGMSELSVKQFASRFQAMGTAMGLPQKKMASMSVELTKLTADMASFYDVEQSDVAKNLQAIFSGETEPLRKYGLDLTQATLQEYANKKGIDAKVKSMTQAQKAMLRYSYVMENTSAAQGDFARTVDTWHNQVTILKQSLQQFGGIVGGSLINAFKPFLRALNVVMERVNTFAESVTNALGSIFGWKYEVTDKGIVDDWSSAADNADDLADSIGDAADNTKKLNKGVRAFDELNLITEKEDKDKNGSGSSSGSGASGGLVQTDTIFKDYESNIKNLYQLGQHISNSLSQAMENIDWERIYAKASGFGTGLAQFLNGLINPRIFANMGKTVANSINTVLHFLDSFGTTFNWSNFGESLGAGLNAFLKGIDWKLALKDGKTYGKGLASAINSFFSTTDFSAVGSTVANALNTAIQFVLNFGLTLDFEKIGDGIADAINGFFRDFQFRDLAKAINTWVKGIKKTLKTAIKNVDWKNVFKGIAEFLDEIELDSVAFVVGIAYLKKFGTVKVLENGLRFLLLKATEIISKYMAKRKLEATLGDIVFNTGNFDVPQLPGNVVESKFSTFFKNLFTKVSSVASKHGGLLSGIGKGLAFVIGFKIGWDLTEVEMNPDEVEWENAWKNLDTSKFTEISTKIQEIVNVSNQAQNTLKTTIGEVIARYSSVSDIADKYYSLSSNYNSLTEEQRRLLKSYADILKENVNGVEEYIDPITGAYSGTKEELDNLIESTKKYYLVAAAKDSLLELQKNIFNLKVEKQRLSNEFKTKKADDIKYFTDLADGGDALAKALIKSGFSYDDLDKKTKEFYKQTYTANGEFKKHIDNLGKYPQDIAAINDEIEQTKESVDIVTRAIETEGQSLEDTAETAKVTTQSTAENIRNMTAGVSTSLKSIENQSKETAEKSASAHENAGNRIVAANNNTLQKSQGIFSSFAQVGENGGSLLSGSFQRRILPMAQNLQNVFSEMRDTSDSQSALLGQTAGSTATEKFVDNLKMTLKIREHLTNAGITNQEIAKNAANRIGAAMNNPFSDALQFGAKLREILQSANVAETAINLGKTVAESVQKGFALNRSTVQNEIIKSLGGYSVEVGFAASRASKAAANGDQNRAMLEVLAVKSKAYASGGFPDKSSFFFAGENGVPELLGTVGGKTAVAGGVEITGIKDAITDTSQQEIELLRQQNQLLQGILNKEFGISKTEIGKASRSYAKEYFNRTGKDAYSF